MSATYDLPRLRVRGDVRAMGQAIGEHWRGPIHAFVEARWRALRANLWAAGSRDLDGFTDLARRCLASLAAWDETAHAEHQAVAAAAAVDSVRLFAAYNLTDLRDLALFGSQGLLAGSRSDTEGCTAVAIPAARCADGSQIVGQTWDLNPPDIDFVVAVQRLPDDGPETWSVSLVGSPNLIGMNEHGLWFGTTNIKTVDAQVGVGYMNVLHRASHCREREEALALVERAPRAGAHTYWLADAGGASELECSATQAARHDCQHEALVQTNHCLDPAIIALAAEPQVSSSSSARLLRATCALSERDDWSVERLRALFADRSDGLDSINRLHDDGLDTATNACAIAVPARRELHVCRGPANRGAWQTLAFER